MRAVISININESKKWGKMDISITNGMGCSSMLNDEDFESREAILDALKEIFADYVNNDINRSLDMDEEDD